MIIPKTKNITISKLDVVIFKYLLEYRYINTAIASFLTAIAPNRFEKRFSSFVAEGLIKKEKYQFSNFKALQHRFYSIIYSIPNPTCFNRIKELAEIEDANLKWKPINSDIMIYHNIGTVVSTLAILLKAKAKNPNFNWQHPLNQKSEVKLYNIIPDAIISDNNQEIFIEFETGSSSPAKTIANAKWDRYNSIIDTYAKTFTLKVITLSDERSKNLEKALKNSGKFDKLLERLQFLNLSQLIPFFESRYTINQIGSNLSEIIKNAKQNRKEIRATSFYPITT